MQAVLCGSDVRALEARRRHRHLAGLMLLCAAALRAGLQLQGYDANALQTQLQSAQSSVQNGISDAQSALDGLNGAQDVSVMLCLAAFAARTRQSAQHAHSSHGAATPCHGLEPWLVRMKRVQGCALG